MKQRVFTALTLTASMLTLTIPSFVQAQTTRIDQLQQRSPGITVAGEVTSVVGNDFVLNDGTGEIIVDAGPTWWHEIGLEAGEQVTVTGELSKKSSELDAFSITSANGSRIDIRSPEGPPPWARGQNRRDRTESNRPPGPKPRQ
jgi:hypothetical protein